MEKERLYFFASDVHLGVFTDAARAKKQEDDFLSFLDRVCEERGVLFLLGDVFDFWFEFNTTIPKGYARVLARLTEMTRQGVEIHFFKGNHDMWTCGYLQNEVGLIVHDAPEVFTLNGLKIMLGHGHNLGVYESFRVWFMLSIFTSRWLYRTTQVIFHPDWMMWFGRTWSRSSRKGKHLSHTFSGEDEFLVRYCNRFAAEGIDYFVFGHLHTPVVYPLKAGGELIVLGQWISDPYYARLEGSKMNLVRF